MSTPPAGAVAVAHFSAAAAVPGAASPDLEAATSAPPVKEKFHAQEQIQIVHCCCLSTKQLKQIGYIIGIALTILGAVSLVQSAVVLSGFTFSVVQGSALLLGGGVLMYISRSYAGIRKMLESFSKKIDSLEDQVDELEDEIKNLGLLITKTESIINKAQSNLDRQERITSQYQNIQEDVTTAKDEVIKITQFVTGINRTLQVLFDGLRSLTRDSEAFLTISKKLEENTQELNKAKRIFEQINNQVERAIGLQNRSGDLVVDVNNLIARNEYLEGRVELLETQLEGT